MEKDKKDINTQKNILNTIIGEGMKFTISYTEKTRQKGFFGLFKRKVYEERKETFEIKEPTLSVLDRMSKIWVEFGDIDFSENSSSVLGKGWQVVSENADNVARVLAIAVLGERYNSVEGGDEKEIERLHRLFKRCVKPSQVMEIAMYLQATSNIADFINSMRLMKMSVTTAPTKRIE